MTTCAGTRTTGGPCTRNVRPGQKYCTFHGGDRAGPAQPKARHVVMQKPPMGEGADMVCLHCGERKSLETPVALKVMTKRLNGFQKLHEDCPPKVAA